MSASNATAESRRSPRLCGLPPTEAKSGRAPASSEMGVGITNKRRQQSRGVIKTAKQAPYSSCAFAVVGEGRGAAYQFISSFVRTWRRVSSRFFTRGVQLSFLLWDFTLWV